jgi:hypothetical protein
MMDRRHRLPVVAGIVLLAGSLGWILHGVPARPVPAAPVSTDGAAALDGINDKLDRLSDRIDRIEAEQRRAAAAGSYARPVDAGKSGLATMPSPQALEARAAEQLRTMEARLVGDPLSPAWASSNEDAIGNLLSAGNLTRQHLPVPEASAARCQSHLCRISMTFPDEAQASRTQEMLLMAIAPSLPSAQTYVLPRPDGSIEMVIFAGDPVSVR